MPRSAPRWLLLASALAWSSAFAAERGPGKARPAGPPAAAGEAPKKQAKDPAGKGPATPDPQKADKAEASRPGKPDAQKSSDVKDEAGPPPGCVEPSWQTIDEAVAAVDKTKGEQESAKAAGEVCRTRLPSEVANVCATPAGLRNDVETLVKSGTAEDVRAAFLVLCGKTKAAAESLEACAEAIERADGAEKDMKCKKYWLASKFGVSDEPRLNLLVLAGDEAELAKIQRQAMEECYAGKDIDEIGRSAGVVNVTRQEGLVSGDPDPRRTARIGPDSAIFFMPVWYIPSWNPQQDRKLRLRCVRPGYFTDGAFSSVEVFAASFPPGGAQTYKLLNETTQKEVSEKLQFARSVALPVRKLLHYTKDDNDEILMNGQDVGLAITRNKTALEKRRGGPEAVVRTTWHFTGEDMPLWSLRVYPFFGVALDRQSDDGKPITATGIATALSYRYSTKNDYYLRFEPLVQFAFRNGSNADGQFPDWTYGIGGQVDISGLLGVGLSWVKNITWKNPPVLMVTLVPASSKLKGFIDKQGLFAPK